MAKDRTGDEGAMTLILLFIVIVFILVGIWFLFHAQLSKAISWVRYAEMSVASVWVPENFRVAMPETQSGKEAAFDVLKRHDGLTNPLRYDSWRAYIPGSDGNAYKFRDFGNLSLLALTPWKWVVAALLALMGVYAMLRAPSTYYRGKFNLDGLIDVQSKVFPQIAPFINFNPNDMTSRVIGEAVPKTLPLFSEALSPEEWVAYNRISFEGGVLDEKAAIKSFAAQLGDRWRGAKHLKPYQIILLAAFCLKSLKKRDEADAMLARLATCWDYKKGLNLSRSKGLEADALKILKNKTHTEEMMKVLRQHAYVTTAMIRALHYARSEGGVLAPAQFVWLRGYDRSLWYALNNLGRQAFHMEAMGAMSHYRTEKRTRRPVPTPRVGDAVQGLKEHLSGLDAREIPPLEGEIKDNKEKRA